MRALSWAILLRADGVVVETRHTPGTPISEWARKAMEGKPRVRILEYPAAGGVMLVLDPEAHQGYRSNPIAERFAGKPVLGNAIYLPGKDEYGMYRFYSQKGAEREVKILRIAAR